MPQKSNKTNIIITLVAIVIILGGVFILNQAISNSSGNEEEAASTEKKDTTQSTNNNETRNGSSTGTNNNQTQTDAQKAAAEKQKKEAEDKKLADEKKLAEEKKKADEAKAKETVGGTDLKLEKGQIALKILDVGATAANGLTPYKLEIVDSTFADSKFFKKGQTINQINLRGFNVQKGKTYKSSIDFTESGSTFTINTISILGEI